jgi:hypothetical protein
MLKKFRLPIVSQITDIVSTKSGPGVVTKACSMGGRGRTVAQGQPEQKHKTLSEKQTKSNRTGVWLKCTSVFANLDSIPTNAINKYFKLQLFSTPITYLLYPPSCSLCFSEWHW